MVQVSVIIPAYNVSSFVAESVQSVLVQTFPAHEIIVVDDGSTDDTPHVLASFGDRIRVIRQRNSGVAAARNAGASAATGDVLAFLDGDDVWLTRKLECQLERLRSDPELGLVHCAYEEIDPQGQVLVQRKTGMEGWVAEQLLLFGAPVILGPGSTAVIPRKVFLEVGGFDTDRRLPPSEDFDLCYRIAARYKVGFVPEVLMRYRQHGNNAHLNVARMDGALQLIYAKIFFGAGKKEEDLRRHAYGNLHMMLAGSYLAAGQPLACARNAVRGIWLRPRNILRVLGYPVRVSRRLARRRLSLS